MALQLAAERKRWFAARKGFVDTMFFKVPQNAFKLSTAGSEACKVYNDQAKFLCVAKVCDRVYGVVFAIRVCVCKYLLFLIYDLLCVVL